MTTQAGTERASDSVECWCCGQLWPTGSVIHLGSHPEVGVCLRCAHFLHQQAWSREDATRRSLGSRLRSRLRSGRAVVIERGWHRKPVIGNALRWLGRHLP